MTQDIHGLRHNPYYDYYLLSSTLLFHCSSVKKPYYKLYLIYYMTEYTL